MLKKTTSEGTKKMEKAVKIALFSFVILIAFLVTSIFLAPLVLANRAYWNTKVGEFDVSLKNKSQIQTQLETKNKVVTTKKIVLRTEEKELITSFADIGVALAPESTASQAIDANKEGNYLQRLRNLIRLTYTKHLIKPEVIINQELFEKFVIIANDNLAKPATNAQITIENGETAIIDGTNGYNFVKDSLSGSVAKAIASSQYEINVETSIAEPEITSAELVSAKNEAMRITDLDLVLDYGSTSYKPTKEEKGKWVTFVNTDGKIYASLDESKVLSYLDTLKGKIDKNVQNERYDINTNEIIQSGTVGSSLNKTKTLANIKNAVNKGITKVTLAVDTTDPGRVAFSKDFEVEVGKASGKYLDANLTKQKMCLVIGYEVSTCLTISSGKNDTPTPIGNYSIYQKLRQNISPIVILNWWQRFAAGGYGIHEIPMLPDGTSVGARSLGTKASHGCLRLGIGDAEYVYNWTEIGTKIFVHN